MKRLSSFLLICVLLFNSFSAMSLSANAKENNASVKDNSNLVIADDVLTKRGETITLPVKLNKNGGLMGFRITVKYPNSVMKLKDVSSGSITKNGMFNTTVTSYETLNGSFDILWSNTSEVSVEGTLAVLTFKIRSDAKNGDYQIKFDYSQEDTFDGNYKDVHFNCKPVSVLIGEEKETSSFEEKIDEKTQNNDVSVSDDFLVSTVNDVLYDLGGKELSELSATEKEKVLRKVNSKIALYDKNAVQYSDFEVLCDDYNSAAQNEAVKKVLNSADDIEIISAINSVLGEYKVKRFKDIPRTQQSEAFKKIEQKLFDKNADVSGFDNISKEKMSEVINEILKQSEDRNAAGELKKEAVDNSSKGKTYLTVIIIAVLCLLVAVFTIYSIKRRKRRANDEKSE